MRSLKEYFPKKLFARGVVLIAAPILLLQVLIVYLVLDRYWDRVTEDLSKISAREITAIMAEPSLTRKQSLARKFNMRVAFSSNTALPPPREISLIDFLHATLRAELKKNIPQPIWIDTTSLKRDVDVRIALNEGVLRVIVPREQVYADKTYQIIVWIMAVGIILLAIAILFLRNQVRPIQRLAVAAKRFGHGLDVQNFKPTGAREVREAGAAFLDMRDNLRAHIAERTNMLSAISHDLRTALTRFKLQLAFLPESTETEALKLDVDHMTLILKDYLNFARGEGIGEKPRRLDLAPFLQDIVRPFDDRIRLNINPALSARIRPRAIKRCLVNLIHNAMNYGERAVINITRTENGIEIIIDDNGVGIDKARYEEAFRPFHRLDEARNQDIAGTGLGLAIARDIARAAGGDITLHPSPEGGLRARLFLPS